MGEHLNRTELRDYLAAKVSHRDAHAVVPSDDKKMCEWVGVETKDHLSFDEQQVHFQTARVQAYAKARYLIADAMLAARDSQPDLLAQRDGLVEALDHPLLREVFGEIEDASVFNKDAEKLFGLLTLWFDTRDAALASVKGGEA